MVDVDVKGKVLLFVGINIVCSQYFWMYYVGVKNFKLVIVFVYFDRVIFLVVLDIYFSGWFCEGEVICVKMGFDGGVEEGGKEFFKYLFQVCYGYVFVDCKVFDLVEYWGVGLVVVGMVDVIWINNLDWCVDFFY